VTFDPGWEGAVEGAPATLLPTALGQIGVALPAGERTLRLRYQDPWLGVGAALALIGLLAAALAWSRQRRAV
jgi:uncharacterized membrane protein YfhO